MAYRQSELGCKSKYGKRIVPIYIEEEMAIELNRRAKKKFISRQSYIRMAISAQFQKDDLDDAWQAAQVEAANTPPLEESYQ